MKKRIILVLCLLLAACAILTACGKKEPQDLTNSKYLGTWKAVSMKFKDKEEPYEDECILVLNPDGKASFTVEGEESSNPNWEETGNGIKLTGDAKMTFTEDGDALTSKIAGVTLRFERQ